MAAPESYKIIPVSALEEIKKSLGSNPKEIILDILQSMDDIVPMDIAKTQVDTIVDSLLLNSSTLNKVWVVDGEVAGFLVCREEDHSSEKELYISHFGFKKEKTGQLPFGMIRGNIKKLISKARKRGFDRVSLHGFNAGLNRVLMRGFKFKEDKSKALDPKGANIPYLVLQIGEEKPLVTEKIDLHNLETELRSRRPDITEGELAIIKEKVITYLQKTESTDQVSWSSLSDAIEQSFSEVVSGRLGIFSAVKRHSERMVTVARKFRQELANTDVLAPDLLVKGEKISLFNLVNHTQL